MQQLEGQTIDQYLMLYQLAQGGMSQIYLAHDRQADQKVALKLVHRANSEDYARFRQEVQAMSTLSHEHILPILNAGEYEDWYYLATPYIEDGTLADRLALGPLSLDFAEAVLEQLTAALMYAHEQGIIHRDIKPSNVLLENGRHVYLADFGLAKSVSDQRGLTISSTIIGTPEYLAPELAEQQASPRSDVYAMGVLLYEMLTGQVPFQASHPLAVCLKHMTQPPLPPSYLNPKIPKAVENVILQALHKEPHKRLSSAGHLMMAYRQAMMNQVPAQRELAAFPTLAMQLNPSRRRIGWLRTTHPVRALMAVATGLVLLLPLSIGMISSQTPPQISAFPHNHPITVEPGPPGHPPTGPGATTEASNFPQTDWPQGTLSGGSGPDSNSLLQLNWGSSREKKARRNKADEQHGHLLTGSATNQPHAGAPGQPKSHPVGHGNGKDNGNGKGHGKQ